MSDLIDRQAAIDALHTWFRDGFDEDKWWNSTHVLAAIEGLPSAQQGDKWETCFDCPLSHGCTKIKGCTNEQAIEYASQIPNDCPLSTQQKYEPVQPEPSEITDEQAILHLQSTGWMQRHDKEMYESGLKEQLADDSDSYDSLLPAVHPEVIRCKNCEHWKNEHLCERLSRFGSLETKADFYCGYAERKN